LLPLVAEVGDLTLSIPNAFGTNHLSYKPFSELLLPLVVEVEDLTLSIPNTFGTPT